MLAMIPPVFWKHNEYNKKRKHWAVCATNCSGGMSMGSLVRKAATNTVIGAMKRMKGRPTARPKMILSKVVVGFQASGRAERGEDIKLVPSSPPSAGADKWSDKWSAYKWSDVTKKTALDEKRTNALITSDAIAGGASRVRCRGIFAIVAD